MNQHKIIFSQLTKGGITLEELDDNSLRHIFMQVIRLHFLRSHSLLENTGIYPGQPPFLFALYKKDGQSQKELGENLGVKPSTITVTTRRLEKNGVVERRQDEKDQRKSRIFLTEKGRKMCKELKDIHGQITEESFKGLTKDEKVIFRRLLMQIRDNLTEACKNADIKGIEKFCRQHK